MNRRSSLILALSAVVLLVAAGLTWRHFHNPLAGAWAATDREADGAAQTTTYTFLKDGLATIEVRTDKGSLLTIYAGGLLGGASGGSDKPGDKDANPLAAVFGAMFPTVRRAFAKGTYTVKDDVITLNVADVNLFDERDQPVSLSNETHSQRQIIRYKVSGDTLTLDKLDGTTPMTLTRRKG